MKKNKNFRYYALIFGFATLAVFLYGVIDTIANKVISNEIVFMIVVTPILFTTFLFVFDKIFDLIFPKVFKPKQNTTEDSKDFMHHINHLVESQVEFSIEDFRRIRVNEKFQKALKQSYKIYINGETEEISYEFLLKKFKKDTNEFKAINIVVEEVKKLKENS